MLCEECKQNEAEVLMTTLIGGVSVTRHLCRECVKKYQLGDIQGVLAAILASMATKQAQEKPDITCENCGMTFSAFQKGGRLGCAQCYTAFREELQPILTRIHGRAQHAGRRPYVNDEEKERIRRMDDVRRRMEEAVAVEDFEQAAVLRDQLRALSQTGEGTENG